VNVPPKIEKLEENTVGYLGTISGGRGGDAGQKNMCLGPYLWPENQDVLNSAIHAHESQLRFALITQAMKPRPASCPENDTHIGDTHESPRERRDGGAGISVPGQIMTGAGICVRGHGRVCVGVGRMYIETQQRNKHHKATKNDFLAFLHLW